MLFLSMPSHAFSIYLSWKSAIYQYMYTPDLIYGSWFPAEPPSDVFWMVISGGSSSLTSILAISKRNPSQTTTSTTTTWPKSTSTSPEKSTRTSSPHNLFPTLLSQYPTLSWRCHLHTDIQCMELWTNRNDNNHSWNLVYVNHVVTNVWLYYGVLIYQVHLSLNPSILVLWHPNFHCSYTR